MTLNVGPAHKMLISATLESNEKKLEQTLPKNYTKHDIDCHMDFLCHYGNFLDDTSYK